MNKQACNVLRHLIQDFLKLFIQNFILLRHPTR